MAKDSAKADRSAASAERDDAHREMERRDDADTLAEDSAAPAAEVAAEPGDAAANAAVRSGAVSFEDDDRADMARSIAARRGADLAEEAATADAGGEGEAAADVSRETPAQKAPARRVRFDELDPDAIVVLKVNGRDLEVAAGDLVSQGQKYLAGDDYFRQGKEFLDSARRSAPKGDATADNQRGDPADGQTQPERRDATPPASRTTRTKVDAATLVPLADKLQTGTAEEAAAALADLLNQRGDGAVNQGDVARMVREERANDRVVDGIRSEVNEALSALSDNHGNLTRIDELAPSLYTGGIRRMVENLRKIGVPEVDLAQPPTAIVEGYGKLRQDANWRDKLPSIKDVYDSAATDLEQKLKIEPTKRASQQPAKDGQRAGQPVVRSTIEREVRRTTIPQQPRPAAIRSDAGTIAAPQERNASAVIDRMKQQRDGGIELLR